MSRQGSLRLKKSLLEKASRWLDTPVASVFAAILFVILSIEKGFFVRPAYFVMAAIILINLDSVFRGFREMPAALFAILIVTTSVFQSLDFWLSVKFSLHANFTIVFGVVCAGYLCGKDEKRVKWWYDMYIISGVITSLFCIAQFVYFIVYPSQAIWSLGPIPRVNALMSEPSYLAFFLAPIFFAAFGVGKYRSAGIIALGVLLSTSRTGLVGIIGGGIALAFIRPKKFLEFFGTAIKYILLLLPLLLIIPSIRSSASYLADFVVSGFINIEEKTSAYNRLLTWLYAVEIFIDNPIFGTGIQGYGPEMHSRGRSLNRPAEEVRTTNLFLEILAEFGVVGFVAFMWWVLSPIIKLWKFRKDDRVMGIISCLLSMILMFPFVQNWWRPYMWVAWVIAYVISSKYEKRYKP